MAVWFTADTHFSHANINKYSKRPFDTVWDMDTALLNNINKTVKKDDVLYHLGDFSFGDVKSYREAIVCENIFLITGNHDKDIIRNKNGERNLFIAVMPVLETTIEGHYMILYHYAQRVWNRSHHGSWHLYGHSHGSLPDDPNSLSFDVGVDCWDYKPINMKQVAERMATKTFVPIDHHGSRDFEKQKRVTRY